MVLESTRSRPFGWVDAATFISVALICVAVYGWVAAYATTVTTFTDSLDYLVMADFYRAALHGGDIDGPNRYYQVSRFPPLFPMLLGAFGGGSEHQHAAGIISGAIAVLAALAVWWWIRVAIGSAWLASFIALALTFLPHYFALNTVPLSEPLGVLLMASVFALAAVPKPTRNRLLVIGLIIGVAPLARTALLPLSIAFVIWLAISRPLPWRKLVLPVLVAWAPFLLWAVYRKSLGAQRYSQFLTAEQFAESGITWPDALWQQPFRVFDAFVATWGMPDSLFLWALSVVIVALAIVGCVIRVRSNRLDGWFLAGYLALIAIWPFPDELTRFLVAVYPCVLVCCITAARAIDRRLPGIRRPVALSALLVIVMGAHAPGVLRTTQRAMLPVDAELLGDKREPGFFLLESDKVALIAAEIYGRARILLMEARDVVPPGKCIYGVPPQLVALYSQRNPVPYPEGLGSDPLQVKDKLQACDYFLVAAWSAPAYRLEALYPLDGLTGWTEPLLISNMTIDGRTRLAVMLLQRAPDSEGEGVDAGMADDDIPEI
jgi:hypothetical protein